jgi:hypothetical protein
MPNFGTRTRPALISTIINDVDVVSVINSYLEPKFSIQKPHMSNLVEAITRKRMRLFIGFYNRYSENIANRLRNYHNSHHQYSRVSATGDFLERLRLKTRQRLLNYFNTCVFLSYQEKTHRRIIVHNTTVMSCYFITQIISDPDYPSLWTIYQSTRMKKDFTELRHMIKHHLKSRFRKLFQKNTYK